MLHQVGSKPLLKIAGWSATLLLAIAVPASAQTSKNERAPGNEARGKELYMRDGCYECHGRAGQGSSLSGPRVGPNPIPFSALLTYLRQPLGQMPPYTRKVMSDSELADIYAFLQALPKPPEVKDIPVLKNESQ